MAKKRKAMAIVRRVVEPTVRAARHTRAALSRGGPKMTGKQIAAGLAGTVSSGVLTYGLGKVGVPPTVATLGLSGIGGVGAFLLEGAGQAAAAGAAAGGLLMAINKALVEHDIKKAVDEQMRQAGASPPQVAQPPVRRQAALPPGDVQAAFDAARAQLGRPIGPYAHWPLG
jgi:hypothetical protein